MSAIDRLKKSFDAAHHGYRPKLSSEWTRIDNEPGTKIRHWKRIRDAALAHGNEVGWNVVANCQVGAYCHSSYCRDCRSRGVASHTRRMLALHRELHGDDDQLARRNLRFTTVLCDLVLLNEDMIQESITRANKTLKSIRRSFPGLGTHGRFELEAIDMVAIDSGVCPRKRQVMDYLNRTDVASINDDRVLVHFHIIMLLNGHDVRQVQDKFVSKWPGVHRVKIDTFHSNKSVEDSIGKLCSYMLKNRVTYNHSMKTDGFNNNRYIKDETLSFLLSMSNRCDDNSLLIYSKNVV